MADFSPPQTLTPQLMELGLPVVVAEKKSQDYLQG